MEFTEVTYKNQTLKIAKYLYDLLLESNIELNDDYIDYLYSNESPLHDDSLTFLAELDYYNKKYLGKDGYFGKIIQLNKKLEKTNEYETVFDAVINNVNKDFNYTLEKFYNNKIYPIKYYSCDFFGIEVDNKEIDILKELNRIIRHERNWLKEKNRYCREFYTGKALNFEYHDYLIKKSKRDCFEFSSLMNIILNDISGDTYNNHVFDETKLFEEKLTQLLKRYTVNNQCYFKKVESLKQYQQTKGIFLFVSNIFRGIFVSNININIKTNFFEKFDVDDPEPFFMYLSPCCIDTIYLLESDKDLTAIERDCIAILGKDIVFNDRNGIKSKQKIRGKNYNPKEYILSDSDLAIELNKL